jgi:hypothetical protein
MMGVHIGTHHFSTFIQMKVVLDHVLTEEWQQGKGMYPMFVYQTSERTRVKPVSINNFLIYLEKLCNEGKAECFPKDGSKSMKKYRRL